MEKIKKESLESIKSIQTDMNKIQQELGAISLLEARKSTLISSHTELEMPKHILANLLIYYFIFLFLKDTTYVVCSQ